MKCFYHNDLDGKCSAAIVVKAMKNKEDDGTGFQYIEMNYNKEFPFDIIDKNEEVVIVDYSLQNDGDFEKLMDLTSRITWIDHHKTAIEKWKHLDGKIKGIRRDGVAGCVLTWEYYFDANQIPTVVSLLGDYDVWTFVWTGTMELQMGIKLYDTNPLSGMWRNWLSVQYNPREEINEGKALIKYQNNKNAELVKAWSFITEFEGYKVIACNAGSVNSQLFDSVTEDYDLMMPFAYDGKQWGISIYTKKDIDVSELAKKYGGGGHAKAAGFQCSKLPFKGR